jgi:hypothetical protein
MEWPGCGAALDEVGAALRDFPIRWDYYDLDKLPGDDPRHRFTNYFFLMFVALGVILTALHFVRSDSETHGDRSCPDHYWSHLFLDFLRFHDAVQAY